MTHFLSFAAGLHIPTRQLSWSCFNESTGKPPFDAKSAAESHELKHLYACSGLERGIKGAVLAKNHKYPMSEPGSPCAACNNTSTKKNMAKHTFFFSALAHVLTNLISARLSLHQLNLLGVIQLILLL